MPLDHLPRLSVLIGADSLAIRRSGVGRMTLEIARAARAAAAIDYTGLLLSHGVETIDVIDHLDDDPITHPRLLHREPVPWKVAIGRIPGVQLLRQIKHGGVNRTVRKTAAAHGGRLVYHEPNMIARPIRLPTVVDDQRPVLASRAVLASRRSGCNGSTAICATTLRRARRFVAISQFTKDAVVRELGVAADRIDVVPWLPPGSSVRSRRRGAPHAGAARPDGPELRVLHLHPGAAQEFRPAAGRPSTTAAAICAARRRW